MKEEGYRNRHQNRHIFKLSVPIAAKEAAKIICLLREKGVNSYDELVELTEKLSARFGELSDSIKAEEKRMVEIGALQTHINNYAKTRAIYEAYRKSGYSKNFFEEHREEI